jgi:hypothetical protein
VISLAAPAPFSGFDAVAALATDDFLRVNVYPRMP